MYVCMCDLRSLKCISRCGCKQEGWRVVRDEVETNMKEYLWRQTFLSIASAWNDCVGSLLTLKVSLEHLHT